MVGRSAGGDLEQVGARLRTALALRVADGAEPGAALADLYVSPDAAWASLADADLSPFAAAMDRAAGLLGLDPLSVQVLWLCAAPELDERYGRVYAFMLDDASRRLATPRLVASVLAEDGVDPGDVLACLSRTAPLRQRGCVELVEPDAPLPLADCSLRVAGELVAHLLGSSLETASEPRITRRDPPDHPLGRPEALARIRAALDAPGRAPVLASGPDAPDLLAVAAGRGLLVLDARAAGDEHALAQGRLTAVLEDRALVYGGVERLEPDEVPALEAAIESEAGRALLCSARAGPPALAGLGAIAVEVPMPGLAERRAAWSALAAGADTDEVAAKFRLSAEQIARAAAAARVEAALAGRPRPDAGDLDAGARLASASGLGERAMRLEPGLGWDDLVLPERQLQQLQSISAYLRHRDLVFTEWGYDRTAGGRLGLAVLFAGDSGTGKTFAAKVLAADLGFELVAINLATVVSKFVGETEQNLERIFAAAEHSNAILFFDEADALFARRSEVKDSRDRYANLEVAYLLQRMESHSGAVILATNLKQNLDGAFLRRLDFVIDFRLPEADDRRRLWQLAIPAKAPVAADVDLDELAERFKLSGGAIRNCALAAAFEAASAGQRVRMAHLVRAIATEYGKLGRLTVEADFGRYHGMLRDPTLEPAPEPEPPPAPAPEPVPERVRIGARIEEL